MYSISLNRRWGYRATTKTNNSTEYKPTTLSFPLIANCVDSQGIISPVVHRACWHFISSFRFTYVNLVRPETTHDNESILSWTQNSFLVLYTFNWYLEFNRAVVINRLCCVMYAILCKFSHMVLLGQYSSNIYKSIWEDR